MKIAIIADVHDNWANLEKVLRYLKENKIKTILCLGDLSSLSTLKLLMNNFKGQIHYIFGNNEIDLYPTKKISINYKNLNFYEGEIGEIVFQKSSSIDSECVRIAITHFPKIANKLAKSTNYNYVFYGHTHKPDIKQIQKPNVKCQNSGTILANPGNLCGIFYKPSFAVYDTKQNKLELKILENIKI